MLDLYELRRRSLGYHPGYTADICCSYDGQWALLDAIGYQGSLASMTSEDAAFIRRQLEVYAQALYLWEIISLWDVLLTRAP